MLETLGIEAKKYNEHLQTTSQQDNQLQSLWSNIIKFIEFILVMFEE